MSTFNINNKNLFTTTEITKDFNNNNQTNNYIKNKFDENDLLKKYLLDKYYTNKLKHINISSFSSIQALGKSKYLVGTATKGFWLLEFNNNGLVLQANKIEGSQGVEITDLTTAGGVGWGSSIQKLGDTNKYLVGTLDKGFWFLKFDNGNNQFTAKKIKDLDGNDVPDLTSRFVGHSSSIQKLGDTNKYLVGTGTKGFWLLEFKDDTNQFIANNIEGVEGVDVLKLTDGDVGTYSSIQKLGENKYLVGTGTNGFWLLEFNNNGLVVQANKIQDENGDDVPVLTTDGDVGFGSSIQKLGDTNNYLVGTGSKDFWLLKFNNDGLVVQANKIQGDVDVDVTLLTTDGDVGRYSSIQALGNNKYLIGTFTKGFWFLKFNDDGLVVQANRIQDSNNKNVSDLTSDDYVCKGSSIQKLGDTNKYLVGTNNKGFWLLEFNNKNNKFIAKKIHGEDVVDVFEKGDLIFNSLFGNSDINVFISKTADTVFTIEESTKKLTINKNNINNLSDGNKLNLINLINLFESLNKYKAESDILDFIKEILNKKSLSSEQKDIALGLKKDEDYAIYKDEDSKTKSIITSKDFTSENQITFKKLTQILKTITDDNDHSKKKKVIETFTSWLSVTLNLKRAEWEKNKQTKPLITSEEPTPTTNNKIKIIVPVVVIGLILLLISTFFIIKYKKSKLKTKK